MVLNSYFPLLAWLSWMLRVPHRAGNCKEKYAKIGLFTCPMPYTNIKEYAYYQTDYLAEKIGMALGVDLSVSNYRCDVSSPTNHEKTHIQELLRRNGVMGEFIVLAPFGNSVVSMDKRMIETIIGFLAQKQYFCVVIGGSSDLVSQILEETSYRQVVNLCGQTSVTDVVALLQGGRLLVSMDSGPMHIGCAVGCETVAVFGSAVMSEWTPKEHCRAVGLRLPCSGPCELTPDKCKDHKCIRLFPENMLFDGIQEALSHTR